MNKFIRINNEAYEIYLSSNGVILIEDLLGIPLTQLDVKNIGFKTSLVMLTGCLYQKNKLSLNEVCDLFDRLLQSNEYSINDINKIIKDEILKWSYSLKSTSNNEEDKKK